MTLVPPPLGAAVALTDAVPGALDAVGELELSDFFSPDEQPDRPAMNIAAPPTATTNPRFTTVLLLFVVTRQDRRIIWVSMGGHPLVDMRLGEKFCLCTNCSLAAVHERADERSSFARFHHSLGGMVRHHADIAHGRRAFHRPGRISLCSKVLRGLRPRRRHFENGVGRRWSRPRRTGADAA